MQNKTAQMKDQILHDVTLGVTTLTQAQMHIKKEGNKTNLNFLEKYFIQKADIILTLLIKTTNDVHKMVDAQSFRKI